MLEALQGIPEPPSAVIEPRVLASYGAILAATLLCVLYIYRGRAFIVYWILSWLMIAGSLALVSRGYADQRVGGVMLGLAQLLTAWSAGLALLAARSFPDEPLRWNRPLKAAAVSAVWFLAAPLLIPLRPVLVTGWAIAGVLLASAAIRYVQLFKWTRFLGAALMAGSLAALALSAIGTAATAIGAEPSGSFLNRILAFNIVAIIFVALGMHLLVFEDMTAELRRTNRQLADANEEVRRLAITDSLTGCYNRRFFDEIERREIQRHQRYRSPFTVMFVDVNRFKQLNDTLGHDKGDMVLRAIGAMLRRHIRSSDYVIRWGGDEFMLLLTCTFVQAQSKAAELRTAFQSDPETANLPGGVGLSVGAAEVSNTADTLVDAIRLADERMYQDKFANRARMAT